jgi:hypothetical protein
LLDIGSSTCTNSKVQGDNTMPDYVCDTCLCLHVYVMFLAHGHHSGGPIIRTFLFHLDIQR